MMVHSEIVTQNYHRQGVIKLPEGNTLRTSHNNTLRTAQQICQLSLVGTAVPFRPLLRLLDWTMLARSDLSPFQKRVLASYYVENDNVDHSLRLGCPMVGNGLPSSFVHVCKDHWICHWAKVLAVAVGVAAAVVAATVRCERPGQWY